MVTDSDSIFDLFAFKGVWKVRHADGTTEDIELAHGDWVEDATGTAGQFLLSYDGAGKQMLGNKHDYLTGTLNLRIVKLARQIDDIRAILDKGGIGGRAELTRKIEEVLDR